MGVEDIYRHKVEGGLCYPWEDKEGTADMAIKSGVLCSTTSFKAILEKPLMKELVKVIKTKL